MAGTGNPSALGLVFANVQFQAPRSVEVLKKVLFTSRTHLKPFLKFAEHPMDRPWWRKGQKSIHGRELEERYGYDRKYRMHGSRLHLESKNYMHSEKFILPSPKFDLSVAIRKGKHARAEIEDMATQFEADAVPAQSRLPLPE
jgi:hypothetical protein